MRTFMLVLFTALFVSACALACAPAAAETQGRTPAAGLDSGGSGAPDSDSGPDAKAGEPGPGEAEGGEPGEAQGCESCGGKHGKIKGLIEKGREFGHEKELRGAIGAIGLLSVLMIILFCGVSVFGLQLLVLMTFPAAVEKVSKTIDDRRIFSFALGLVNCVFLWLLVMVLGKSGGPAGGVAVLFLLVLCAAVFMGLTARARFMGSKAVSMAGFGANPVSQLFFGWLIIFFVGNIPIIGWVLALYWACSGVGGLVLSTFSGGKTKQPPQARIDPKDEYQSPVVTI